mgnify:CR=1 FL=1
MPRLKQCDLVREDFTTRRDQLGRSVFQRDHVYVVAAISELPLMGGGLHHHIQLVMPDGGLRWTIADWFKLVQEG